MYTQCPDCATVYEITTEQLGAAGGLVSCGSCDATFNALRRLSSAPPQTEADTATDTESSTDNLQSELQFDAEDTISGTVDLPGSDETTHSEEPSAADAADSTDSSEQDDDFDIDLISADDIEVIFDDADAGELEAREDLVDELLDDIDLITGDGGLVISDETEEATLENIDNDSEAAAPENIDSDAEEAAPESIDSDAEEAAPESIDSDAEEAAPEDIDDSAEATSADNIDDDSRETDEGDQPKHGDADYEADIEELIQKAEVEIGAIDESKKSAAEADQEDSSADSFIEIDDLAEEDWSTEDGEQVLEALLSDENLLDDDAGADDEEADRGESQTADGLDTSASEEVADDNVPSEEQEIASDTDEYRDDVAQADDSEETDSDIEEDTSIDANETYEDAGNPEDSDDTEDYADAEQADEIADSDTAEEDTPDASDEEDAAESESHTDNDGDQDSAFLEDDELAAQALDPLPISSQDAVSKDPESDTATASANDEPDILTQEVDGSFEQDINDAHDYRDLQRYLKPVKTLPRKIGEWVVVVALVAALGAQFVHQNREALVDHPRYGDRLRDVYNRLGISLIEHWDVTDYRVARHTVVPHSEESRILQARATIINGAASSRPVPLIRFELQNRWGDAIFSRTFAADEYAASPPQGDMRPNARLEVILDLVNPTEEAVFNYNFDVCLPAEDQRVYCAADQVFTQK